MNTPSHAVNSSNEYSINEHGRVTPIDLLDNLFYFRWHFIVTFVVVTTLAVAYAFISTPIYAADVLIQVEEKKGTSLGALTQVANALGAQQSPVLGEIEILRSRSVVGRAVDNLKANIEVGINNRVPIIGNLLARLLPKDDKGYTVPLWKNSNYSWGGERLKFEELTVEPKLIGKRLLLVVGANKSWQLFDTEKNKIAEGDGINRLVNGVNGKLRIEIAELHAQPNTEFSVIVYSIQSRVVQILERYSAVETKRQSSIIKLTYENPNPSFSAVMLNEIADSYLQQNISRRSEEAELSLKFLNDELPKLRTKLDAAEKALNEFRSKSRTMDITSEIRELLVRATSIEKAQLELDLKRREYAVRYDNSHPLMKSVISQLEGVKVEAAELSSQIGRLPLVEQNYIRLARDVQVNNQLYVSLLNNAQQLQIAKAGTTGNVAIVDRALVPEKPSRPRKSVIAAFGALFGLLLGFVLCQTLALISKVVRDPKKLEIDTGYPALAVIPLDFEQMETASSVEKRIYLLAKEKPNASSVEALRSLRTSLMFRLSEKQNAKIVLITSAVPAQGKSFISNNLSYLIAATNKKVLLIEADIRLATARNYINFDASSPGLSSILKDGLIPKSVILKEVFPNMDYLPAGPTVRNPGDLLATNRMEAVIKELAEEYEFIVIDSPPLLPVHDARFLGKSADATLFVVRQDSVSLGEVRDALDVFGKSGNEIDGLVFNGFVPSSLRYGYGYGYSQSWYGNKYRNKYYGGRYGRRYGAYAPYGVTNSDNDQKN